MASYQRSMSFHPHEQRALAPRPVVFADKKRPRGQAPMPGNGRQRPPNDRWGLDPDDLCRRLYSVIAEREGRPVTIRDAQGRTREERYELHQAQERKTAAEKRAQYQAQQPPQNLFQAVPPLPKKPDTGKVDVGEKLSGEVQRIHADAGVKAEALNNQRRRARDSALSTVKEDTSHTARIAQRNASQFSDKTAPLSAQVPQPESTVASPMPVPASPPQTKRGPKSSSGQHGTQHYRHVPLVAAAQFERTTTVESADDRAIHKLSQPAMDFHMAGPELDASRRNDNASPIETMHSLERVRSHRDREYDRNQFQHPPILEELSAHDDRQFRLPMRQTFETHFNKPNGEGTAPGQRFSVGSNGRPRESLEVAGFSIHQERAGDSLDEEAPQMKWRVDWTQSDEARPLSDHSNQAKLRKSESKWKLKGKLSSFQKSKENTVPATDADQQNISSPKSPKSPKSGFFGRFKR